MTVIVLIAKETDLDKIRPALEICKELGITPETRVFNPVRNRRDLIDFIRTRQEAGVFIVRGELLAHSVAPETTQPVIQIKVTEECCISDGLDCSIVKMKYAQSAALLAAQILSLNNANIKTALKKRQTRLADKTREQDRRVRGE